MEQQVLLLGNCRIAWVVSECSQLPFLFYQEGLKSATKRQLGGGEKGHSFMVEHMLGMQKIPCSSAGTSS